MCALLPVHQGVPDKGSTRFIKAKRKENKEKRIKNKMRVKTNAQKESKSVEAILLGADTLS